jgi:alanine racemase
MGRQGFDLASAESDIQYLTRISHIDIEGICTHFSQAQKKDDDYTLNQIRLFRNAAKQLERGGIPYEKMHACNSPGIVNYPRAALDIVRPGLITYGVWPTEDPPAQNPLKPVLRWETTITQVREFPAGTAISYGRTYVTPGRMRAAIIPVGYADGYPWHASNTAQVLVHGRRCPVRGSICMDQTVVDISEVPAAHAGDPVILIGEDRGECITAAELAQWAGTIPYEILSNIGPRTLRQYRGEA